MAAANITQQIYEILVGKEVEQICIGRFQIQVNLSKDCSISIEATINCHKNGTTYTIPYGEIGESGSLLSVIGHRVNDAHQSISEITFSFENGDVWNVLLRNDGYESLSLVSRERTVII